jgi:hypothetical protein
MIIPHRGVNFKGGEKQEMPLMELMEHLAYVVDGEWIAEGEGQCALRSRSSSSARRTFK